MYKRDKSLWGDFNPSDIYVLFGRIDIIKLKLNSIVLSARKEAEAP